MFSAGEYRHRAERALRLANAMGPGEAAERLRRLAAEYHRLATDLEGPLGFGQQQQQPQPDE